MSQINCKTMREVAALLRENAAEALLELFELRVAVWELVANAQTLSAAAAEGAGQAARHAESPGSATELQLRELASAAQTMSEGARAQLSALLEIKRGLEMWNIAPVGLRLL